MVLSVNVGIIHTIDLMDLLVRNKWDHVCEEPRIYSTCSATHTADAQERVEIVPLVSSLTGDILCGSRQPRIHWH